jgi:hypothetical protein
MMKDLKCNMFHTKSAVDFGFAGMVSDVFMVMSVTVCDRGEGEECR